MTITRVRGMQLVSVALFALLAVQLVRLQLYPPAFGDISNAERLRILQLEAPRGRILDRNGAVLADNIPEFAVQAIPGNMPRSEAARRALLLRVEAATGVPFAQLERDVAAGLESVDPFAPLTIREGLTDSEAIEQRAALAGMDGMRVQARAVRVYHGGPLAAHLLGYVAPIAPEEIGGYLDEGYAYDARVGQMGIEYWYEELLRGVPGRRLIIADPAGREVAEVSELEAAAGADIVLSIDLALQAAVTSALQDGIARGAAASAAETGRPINAATSSGAAVLMDVRTGELLALVSLPSFDAEIFSEGGDSDRIAEVLADPMRPLIDRSFMEVQAPGSIFKPLVGAAALQEGVVTPGTRIVSTGAITVQDQYNPDVRYVFRDWAAHGSLDFYGGIARSSDVYYYYLSGGYSENGRQLFDGLGVDRLAAYVRAFGLGSPTGLDLPGETGGLVPDPEWKASLYDEPWVLGDTYTLGIGQGFLTVTPLQMAVAGAAIANGGELIQPTVVHAMQPGGTEARPVRERERVPVSSTHLQVVRDAMRIAADAGGTAISGEPSGMTIGGKTGTAEFGLPLPDGSFDSHAWFLGFGPFEDPEVVVVVYLEHGVGSTHAAPVARQILETYRALGPGSPASVQTDDDRSDAKARRS